MSKFTTAEKMRIVLDGMRYPEGITGLCRQVVRILPRAYEMPVLTRIGF